MEIYILDGNLRRTEVVEQYETFVWTERYSAAGDFVLEIDPSLAESQLRVGGTMLACDQSDRVMVIDTSEDILNDDGNKILKVTGMSLEDYVMSNRPNDYDLLSVGSGSGPVILGATPATPGNIMRGLFADVCLLNLDVTQDQIPNLQTGSHSSTSGAIAEPSATITIQTELDTLYNTIKTIADTYRMGFRLIRVETSGPTGELYFEVYTGFDRTTVQTALPAVVFSTMLDNLTDTSELRSIAAFKNVIYIYAKNGSGVYYEDNTLSTISGFDRKVLVVKASDIEDAAGAGLNAKMAQRAREEFSKNRPVIGFDGKIAQTSGLTYGTSYKLGDLVEQRTESGLRNVMKVTEQIFTSDKEGDKSYPTLALDSLIVPGSWDAVNPAKFWDSYTTEVWDSM